MKKVFVPLKLNDSQKKRIESVSKEYKFVYKKDLDANIILGNYNPSELKDFKNLEWIQTTAVGVDAFIKKGILAPNVLLTNAKDIHSKEVAEHTLGMMLSMVKKLHLYRNDQKDHNWTDEGIVKSIDGLRVCILGFGDIGKCLAKLCKGLGMYVIGVKRKPIKKPSYLDELYLSKDMLKAISNVDVVVSVLPGLKENKYLFDLKTFKAMRKDAILINVGRGNLYKEETLIKVLERKIISGIGADVFEEEPLSKDSKLWGYENFVVTPHVAGYFHLESAKEDYVDLLVENLSRYKDHKKLKYLVDEREV